MAEYLLGDFTGRDASDHSQELDEAIDLPMDAGFVLLSGAVDVFMAAVQVLKIVKNWLIVVPEILFDWA